MIRELIVPTTNHFQITIPDEYLGRQVEFIMFPLEQNEIPAIHTQDINTLGGSLNKYADISKIASEDSAWESYVMDKYK